MNLSLTLSIGVDTLRFYSSSEGISCPPELWFEIICASLRMKKNVLILEKELVFSSQNPSARWEVGENWIHLTPRSLGPIVQSNSLKFSDFPSFQHFLANSK